MSRTFSKVLVICSLIVVIPLLVTGTVMAAFFSIDSTINVSAYFVGGEKADAACGEDVDAKVSCGDESGEEISLTTGHTQDVTLMAVYNSSAYEFLGWFNGNATEYEAAVNDGTAELSTGTTYQISMEEEADYLAVYQVVKYSVSYNYDADPENDGDNVTTVPSGGKTSYIYGEALAKLNNTANHVFLGWTAQEDGQIYEYATFTEGSSLTLSAYWHEGETAKLTLTYGNDSVVLDIYAGVAYSAESLIKKAGFECEEGYKLTIEKVTTISLLEDASYTVVAEPIKYYATIDSTDLADGATTAISFTIEDYSALTNLLSASALETKYSFWEYDGQFTVYNTTYTSAEQIATLVEGVVAGTINSDFTITPSITKNFTSFQLATTYLLKAGTPNTQYTEYGSLDDYTMYVYDEQGSKVTLYGATYDSTATIAQVLGLSEDEYAGNEISESALVAKNGTTSYKLTFVYICLAIVNSDSSVTENVWVLNLSLDSTLNDVIEYILTAYSTLVSVSDSDIFVAGSTSLAYANEHVFGFTVEEIIAE